MDISFFILLKNLHQNVYQILVTKNDKKSTIFSKNHNVAHCMSMLQKQCIDITQTKRLIYGNLLSKMVVQLHFEKHENEQQWHKWQMQQMNICYLCCFVDCFDLRCHLQPHLCMDVSINCAFCLDDEQSSALCVNASKAVQCSAFAATCRVQDEDAGF